MKSLLTAIFAGALLATSPAWADRGHGHGHDKHAHKEWKKAQKHWAKHHRYGHSHVEEHVVVHQHFHSAPPRVVHQQVVVASPPPGVHVVMPNVYIPF